MRRLILASTSKYRRELLARLGMPFDAAAPGVDETALAGEAPAELAARLAAAKARSVRAADAVVIGSDQVASLDGVVLRKPGEPATALRQLERAQGTTVLFHTAVTVLDTASGAEWSHVDLTQVRFARLPTAALERYLEIDEPFDCAGSFKSEGLGVALFERIESTDPTALIGLPLIWLAATLRSAGLDPLAAARAPSGRQ
jgi:septum formation protein